MLDDYDFDTKLASEIDEIGLYKVHTDLVSKLPEGAYSIGSSTRVPNEIWIISDRILCF